MASRCMRSRCRARGVRVRTSRVRRSIPVRGRRGPSRGEVAKLVFAGLVAGCFVLAPEREVRAQDREATLRFNTAGRLYRQENWAEARVAFDEFLTKFGRHEKAGEARFARGYCHLRLERYADAVRDFDSAVRAPNASGSAWFADAYFYAGEARDALAASGDADSARRAALLRAAAKSYGEAAAVWDRVNSSDSRERARVTSRRASALAAQGEALYHAGDIARARETLKPFLDDVRAGGRPARSAVGDAQGRALYFLALAEYSGARGTERPNYTVALAALSVLTEAGRERTPLWEEAAFLAAQIHALAGDRDRALALYGRVVERRGPRAEEAGYRLALTRYDSGTRTDLQAAAKRLSEFRQRSPDHPLAIEALHFEGLALFRLQRFEEAAERLSDLVSDGATPKAIRASAGLTLGQALLLARKADPARAEKVLDRAARDAPPGSKEHAQISFWRGEALLAVNDVDSARAAARVLGAVAASARTVSPRIAEEALFKQAEAAYRAGEHAECAALGERYRRAYPRARARFYVESLKLSGQNALYAPEDALADSVRAVAAEHYEEAAALIDDPAQAAELRYFAGIAHYRAGKFTQAAETLAGVDRARADLEREPAAFAELGFYLADSLAQIPRRSPPSPEDVARAETAAKRFEDYLRVPNRQHAETARVQQGLLYEELGQIDRARDAYRRFLADHPRSERAATIRFALADAHLALEEFERAAEAYRVAAESGGEPALRARAYLQAATLERRLSRGTEALALIERASALARDLGRVAGDGLRARIAFDRASTLLDLGRDADAKTAYARYLKEYAGGEHESECRVQLGYLHVEAGDGDEAMRVVEPLVRGPKSDERRPDALYVRAWALSDAAAASGDPKVATALDRRREADYQTILRDHPRAKIASEARLELAQLFFNRGEWDVAKREFGRVVEAFESEDATPRPDLHLQGQLGLAFVHFQTEDYSSARSLFDRVAGAAEDDAELLVRATFYAGRSWMLSRGVRQARRRFERVVGELKESAGELLEEALLRLGECCHRVEDYTAAAKTYRRQLDEIPDGRRRHEARFGLGLAYQFLDRPDDAVELFTEVTRATTAPIAARAQYHIGECYMDGEKHREAARAFLAVVASFDFEGDYRPWLRRALLAAGIAYAAAGDSAAAETQWKELVARFPGSDEAAAAKTRLEEVK